MKVTFKPQLSPYSV